MRGLQNVGSFIRDRVVEVAKSAAPIVSISKRVARRKMWVETEEHSPSRGPQVNMSLRPEIQRPSDGSGPLNHRTYVVSIANPLLSPDELIEAFRSDPNQFSPTSFAEFEPAAVGAGMSLGTKHVVRLPGPWDGPVIVTKAEERLLRLETLDDHLEAGWIEFSTRPNKDGVEFMIESLASSGDPLFDLLYHRGRVGKFVQTEMWVRVVEAAAEISGGEQVGRVHVNTTIYEGRRR